MKGEIGFEELAVECLIGDLPEERAAPQTLLLDLAVRIDLNACAESDLLESTVDYVALANECRKVAVEGEFFMLEALAAALIERLFALFPIEKAALRVKKPESIAQAKFAFVSLEMDQEAWRLQQCGR